MSGGELLHGFLADMYKTDNLEFKNLLNCSLSEVERPLPRTQVGLRQSQGKELDLIIN